MWKNSFWSKRTMWVVTGIIAVFCIISLGNDSDGSYTFKNGEGIIKHYTGKDWDKDAMYKKMGEKVWKFSNDHPDAKKLTLIIIDECKDTKGDISNYETKITFNSRDISNIISVSFFASG